MCTSVRSEEVLKAPRHQPLLNLFEVCEPWTAARIWCQSRSPAGWDHRHKPAADITLCQRRGEGGREGGRQSKHPDRVLLPQIPALRSGCVGTNYNNFLGCYCVYVKFSSLDFLFWEKRVNLKSCFTLWLTQLYEQLSLTGSINQLDLKQLVN